MQIFFGITYMWNLESNTSESICETEVHSQAQKANVWLPKGKVGGGINWEYDSNKLLYIKQISNKDLLYTRGHYI